jgi:hypothetical protein
VRGQPSLSNRGDKNRFCQSGESTAGTLHQACSDLEMKVMAVDPAGGWGRPRDPGKRLTDASGPVHRDKTSNTSRQVTAQTDEICA